MSVGRLPTSLGLHRNVAVLAATLFGLALGEELCDSPTSAARPGQRARGAKLADPTGRGPIVALTMLFFAAFPLAVRVASSNLALLGAFVIGGLKEIGEPARKSLIVDLAPDVQRARTVGVYYAIRNFLVVPAGLIGGLLWQREPELPLEMAFVVSLIGVVVFVISLRHDW